MFRELAAICFLCFLITRAPAGAATITLQQGNLPASGYTGTLDAFVTNGTTFNASPARNYGGAGALAVSADSSVNPANTQGQFISFIQFDTGAAKSSFDTTFGAGGWTVTGVQLQLAAQSPGNPIFNGNGTLSNTAGNIDIHWLFKDFILADEGIGTPGLSSTSGITFNSLSNYTDAGDQAAGTFNFAGGTSGLFSASLSLTSGLKGDILNGGSIALELLPSAGSQVSAVFNSRNFGTAASRPSLSITAIAVPEPSRAMLLLAGVCFVSLRRSKPLSPR